MSLLLRMYPGDAWAFFIGNVLVQVTVVILAARLLTRLGSRWNAAWRHSIYLVAILCVLASPVLPSMMRESGLTLVTLRPPATLPAAKSEPIPMTNVAESERIPTATITESAIIETPDAPKLAAGPEQVEVLKTENPGKALSAESRSAFSFAEIFRAITGGALMIWLLGIGWLLARWCYGLHLIGVLRRAAQPIDSAAMADLLLPVRQALGTDRLPPIATSASLDRPVMIGLVHPLVILPENVLWRLRGPELTDVLVHECAHAVCRHQVVGFLQRLAGMLFWPHPLVRVLNRELARAREEVCDNYVLRRSDAPRYARTLLELSQLLVGVSPKPMALGLFHCQWRLEDRVADLLDRRRKVMTRINRWTAAGVTATFLLIALLIAGTRLVQAEPAADKAAPASEKITEKIIERTTERTTERAVSETTAEKPATPPAKTSTTEPPALSAAEKEKMKRVMGEGGGLGIDLDVPNLEPQAVQYAFFDEDPVPALTTQIKQVQLFYRRQLNKAADEKEKEQARNSQMSVSWDFGFRNITADKLGLLTKRPDSDLGTPNVRPFPPGKKWIVTKVVCLKGKPICWCIPIDVKTGNEIVITLNENNAFDLRTVYDKAMQGPLSAHNAKNWQVAFDLDAPSISPQAVQYSIFDEDPVPAFVAQVKRMAGHAREQLEKAHSEADKEQVNAAQMEVAWDLGFKGISGDKIYLIKNTSNSSMTSNGNAGRKWFVTKIVHANGKPVCWCIPVEVKTGELIDVGFNEKNMFDLRATYDKAMQEPAGTHDTKPEHQATEPSLLGGWRADSASIAIDGGKFKTITQQDGILTAIISETTLTLRLDDNVLAKMTYTLDTQAKPWTIDARSKDGAMLGICVRRADDLQISLNDQAKGRPKDFDRNHNDMVLVLRLYSNFRISLINADGTGLRDIVSLPEFTRLGTPEWSRDGKKIAFDGSQSIFGPSYNDKHMFTVNVDGSGLKELGRGYMPSWSPDGKQLTYCQFGAGAGVWVMNADGSNRRLIDANGRGSQWSPNSNELAYTLGTEICIRDMATDESRMLPVKNYRYIYWGFDWSPDGKWISFVAAKDDGRSELAAVSTDGKEVKVLMAAADLENGDLCTRNSWGGDGNQILFSLKKSGEGASRLYLLDFAGAKTPHLFPGVPADSTALEPAWSPDGKKVAIIFHPPARPHEEIPTE